MGRRGGCDRFEAIGLARQQKRLHSKSIDPICALVDVVRDPQDALILPREERALRFVPALFPTYMYVRRKLHLPLFQQPHDIHDLHVADIIANQNQKLLLDHSF